VQCLALPLYWWAWRAALGSGLAAGTLTLLTPFVLHAAGLAIGFAVSWRNQHERPGLRHSRRRDWLVAFAGETVVSIRQFYWLMPFRARFRMPAPGREAGGPAILLLHGYGCNRGLWLPTARWLARRGYTVSALDLVPMHASIDDYAGAIGAAVASLRQACGGDRVAIVAHSMGGLAARAYLRHCGRIGADPGVAALVTLGTPHVGTHVARIGLGANARQMEFRSAWTERLRRDESQAGAPLMDPALRRRVLAIGSLQDNIVSRPFEQGLPGIRNVRVRRQGHMSLATSPRVLAMIDRLLRRVPYTRLEGERSAILDTPGRPPSTGA
jgi:pimeloyl-ACP methyl ester carboxylesterase